MRILLLEDEESIRGFIRINLKRNGMEVTEAEDGETALALADEASPPFDIALLDVMLPTISGFEVCGRLRERFPRMGIMMLTAKSQEEDKIRGLELGADDYVQKPFSPGELIARLNALHRRMMPGGLTWSGPAGGAAGVPGVGQDAPGANGSGSMPGGVSGAPGSSGERPNGAGSPGTAGGTPGDAAGGGAGGSAPSPAGDRSDSAGAHGTSGSMAGDRSGSSGMHGTTGGASGDATSGAGGFAPGSAGLPGQTRAAESPGDRSGSAGAHGTAGNVPGGAAGSADMADDRSGHAAGGRPTGSAGSFAGSTAGTSGGAGHSPAGGGGPSPGHPRELSSGPFRLSAMERRLWKAGKEIVLTPTEWTLVMLLMEREGEGLSRDDILDAVWGRHFIGDLKIVDVNIRRIRQKIEDEPSEPRYIETLWGYGYRWKRSDNR